MIKHYFFNINLDKNGNHEIHTESCKYLEPINNRTYIGYFTNCETAIKEAKIKFAKSNFDGCYWCSRDCHNG